MGVTNNVECTKRSCKQSYCPKAFDEKTYFKVSAEISNVIERFIVNRDTFEHSVSEKLGAYSSDTIAKSENEVSVVSSSGMSTASTPLQKRRISLKLASKMAGLKTYYDGGPIVSGKSDADALAAAKKNHSWRPQKAQL